MAVKVYGKDITSIKTPLKIHLPDGTIMNFKNSEEALNWFNASNYADTSSFLDYETNNLVTPEAKEIVVIPTSQNKGIDTYIGANYNPEFNKVYNKMGMNPVNWTDFIPKSYWDSDVHKNIKEGFDIASVVPGSMIFSAAYTVPELAGALNLKFAYDGAKKLISPEGVLKTYNKFKEGDYKGGAISGAGDLFDVAMTLPVLNTVTRASYNAAKPTIIGFKMNNELNKTPIIENETLPLNIGWGPKLTIAVTHKSNHAAPPPLYNEKRWDVVNEGANPFGIWWLGKWGIPRTIETGNTVKQAQKALNARNLFAKRPYTHSGELTLEKPIVTVGDVPNRSTLSYLAELLGADGIIYNNVYDNGFNNNLVILSFKRPDNNSINSEVKNSFSINSDNNSYYWNGPMTTWDNFNIPQYKQDLLTGKLEFIDWMNNPEYIKAMYANKAEAENMGLFYTPIIEKPEYLQAVTNFKPTLHTSLNGANGQIDLQNDIPGVIHLSSKMNMSATPVTRHELAHSARLAYPTTGDINTRKKELEYLRFKNSQVFNDSKADLTNVAGNNFYDFSSTGYPHEAVTNARDLGAKYGIKVGQEYPGDLLVLDLLETMYNNQLLGSFGSKFIEALRTDKEHLKYVWKALNGTLWSLLPFIIGGTIINNNK